jgi:anti-sigma B factor antagonist
MSGSDEFRIEVEHGDGTIVVRLAGDLDLATAPRLIDEISAITDCDTSHRVVFDLAAVEFIDCSGLRALLQSREHIMTTGHGFEVVDARPNAVRLFKLTDTDHSFLNGLRRPWPATPRPARAD